MGLDVGRAGFAAGKKAEDVMPSVRIAEKDAFFNFTKGRILTLDY